MKTFVICFVELQVPGIVQVIGVGSCFSNQNNYRKIMKIRYPGTKAVFRRAPRTELHKESLMVF